MKTSSTCVFGWQWQPRRVAVRLAAAIFLLCGSFSALQGIGSSATAQSPPCPPFRTYFPAHCIHSHCKPPFTGGMNLNCEQYLYFWCEPTSGSHCGQWGDFGQQVAGMCEHFIDESVQTNCSEDATSVLTFIQFYETECRFANCACSCQFISEGQPGTVKLTCDCI